MTPGYGRASSAEVALSSSSTGAFSRNSEALALTD
jgi:hypothetical protein